MPEDELPPLHVGDHVTDRDPSEEHTNPQVASVGR
jgi:hypothetical protein